MLWILLSAFTVGAAFGFAALFALVAFCIHLDEKATQRKKAESVQRRFGGSLEEAYAVISK